MFVMRPTMVLSKDVHRPLSRSQSLLGRKHVIREVSEENDAMDTMSVGGGSCVCGPLHETSTRLVGHVQEELETLKIMADQKDLQMRCLEGENAGLRQQVGHHEGRVGVLEDTVATLREETANLSALLAAFTAAHEAAKIEPTPSGSMANLLEQETSANVEALVSPSIRKKRSFKKVVTSKIATLRAGGDASNKLSRTTSLRETRELRPLVIVRPGDDDDVAKDENEEKGFKQWNTDQVCSWFAAMGLERYMLAVEAGGLTGAALAGMSRAHLERILGLGAAGTPLRILHGKKLLLAVRAQVLGKWEQMSEMDSGWVARWLDDIGLPQHKEAFLEARLDGRVLFYLTHEDLALLKVASAFHHKTIRRALEYLRTQGWNGAGLLRRPVDENDQGRLIHWTNHRVMAWLRDINLSEYASNLRGSGVHGALICLEPRFTAKTLADLLLIPEDQKTLRQDFQRHFDNLIGPGCVQNKLEVSANSGLKPLDVMLKVKPGTLPRSGKGGKGVVCPLEFTVPEFIPAEELPFGYLISREDEGASDETTTAFTRSTSEQEAESKSEVEADVVNQLEAATETKRDDEDADVKPEHERQPETEM